MKNKSRLLLLFLPLLILPLNGCGTNQPTSSTSQETVKYANVNFYDGDRTTILYTAKVKNGEKPVYVGKTPTKKSNGTVYYVFSKWSLNLNDPTLFMNDTDVYPLFTTAPNDTDYSYDQLDDGSYEILSYLGEDTEIVLPSYYNGVKIKAIGASAFAGNITMTGIDISGYYEDIEASAFFQCTSLTKVTISSDLKSIGERTFYNCTALQEINIPETVTNIGDYCFSSTVIEEMILPEGLNNLGSYAFMSCYDLTSVNIPKSLTAIKEGTFMNCMALPKIEIPETITSLGKKSSITARNYRPAIFLPKSLFLMTVSSTDVKSLAN